MNKRTRFNVLFFGICILLFLACALHVTLYYLALEKAYYQALHASFAFVWCIPYGLGILITLFIRWRVLKRQP